MSLKAAIKNILYLIPGMKPVPYLEVLKQKGLKVGKDFNMRQDCIIDFSHAWHIEIGDNVMLAPRVHILAHDASTWHALGYSKVQNVKIGNNVFIGAGSIVLPGVTIGDNVIVGAGSVVTKNIESNSVVAGNPARFLLHTDAYLAREKAKMTTENCFGREFSEDVVLTEKQKEQLKKTAGNGTAFLR